MWQRLIEYPRSNPTNKRPDTALIDKRTPEAAETILLPRFSCLLAGSAAYGSHPVAPRRNTGSHPINPFPQRIRALVATVAPPLEHEKKRGITTPLPSFSPLGSTCDHCDRRDRCKNRVRTRFQESEEYATKSVMGCDQGATKTRTSAQCRRLIGGCQASPGSCSAGTPHAFGP